MPPSGEGQQVLALEAHAAGRRLDQAQHQAADRRLAAARSRPRRPASRRPRARSRRRRRRGHDPTTGRRRRAAPGSAWRGPATSSSALMAAPCGDCERRAAAARRDGPARLRSSGGGRRGRPARRRGSGGRSGSRAAVRAHVGHAALDRRQALALLVEARDRAQQADRVGVLGPGEERAHRRALDDLAGVHARRRRRPSRRPRRDRG